MDFEGMKRRELQALCKQHSLAAGGTNADLVARLAAALSGGEGAEEKEAVGVEMDFKGMKQRELQALCKQHGLAARGSKADLVARLAAALTGDADLEEVALARKGCLKRSGGGDTEAKTVTFVLEEDANVRKLRSRVVCSPVAVKTRTESNPMVTDASGGQPIAVRGKGRQQKRAEVGSGSEDEGVAGEVGADVPVRRSRRNAVKSDAAGGVESWNAAETDGEGGQELNEAVDRKRKQKSQDHAEGIAISAQVGVSRRVTRRSSLSLSAPLLPPSVEKRGNRRSGEHKDELGPEGQAAEPQYLPLEASPVVVESRRRSRTLEDCNPAVQSASKVEVPIRITRSRSEAAPAILPVVAGNKRRKTEDVHPDAKPTIVSDVPMNDAPVTRSLRNRVVLVNDSVVKETNVGKELEKKRQTSRPATRGHQQVATSVEDNEHEQVAAPSKCPPVRRSTRHSVGPATLGKEENKLIAEMNPEAHIRRSMRRSIVPDENIKLAGEEIQCAKGVHKENPIRLNKPQASSAKSGIDKSSVATVVENDLKVARLLTNNNVSEGVEKQPARRLTRSSILPAMLRQEEEDLTADINPKGGHVSKSTRKSVVLVEGIKAAGEEIQNAKGDHLERQPAVKEPVRRSTRKSVLPDMLENEIGFLVAETKPEVHARRLTRKSVLPNILNDENKDHRKTASCEEKQLKLKEPIRRLTRSVAAEGLEKETICLHKEKKLVTPMKRSVCKVVNPSAVEKDSGCTEMLAREHSGVRTRSLEARIQYADSAGAVATSQKKSQSEVAVQNNEGIRWSKQKSSQHSLSDDSNAHPGRNKSISCRRVDEEGLEFKKRTRASMDISSPANESLSMGVCDKRKSLMQCKGQSPSKNDSTGANHDKLMKPHELSNPTTSEGRFADRKGITAPENVTSVEETKSDDMVIREATQEDEVITHGNSEESSSREDVSLSPLLVTFPEDTCKMTSVHEFISGPEAGDIQNPEFCHSGATKSSDRCKQVHEHFDIQTDENHLSEARVGVLNQSSTFAEPVQHTRIVSENKTLMDEGEVNLDAKGIQTVDACSHEHGLRTVNGLDDTAKKIRSTCAVLIEEAEALKDEGTPVNTETVKQSDEDVVSIDITTGDHEESYPVSSVAGQRTLSGEIHTNESALADISSPGHHAMDLHHDHDILTKEQDKEDSIGNFLTNDECAGAKTDCKKKFTAELVSVRLESDFSLNEKDTGLAADNPNYVVAMDQLQHADVQEGTLERLSLGTATPECKHECVPEAVLHLMKNEGCSSSTEQTPSDLQSLVSQETAEESLEVDVLACVTVNDKSIVDETKDCHVKCTVEKTIVRHDTQVDSSVVPKNSDHIYSSQQNTKEGFLKNSHEEEFVVDVNYLKEVTNHKEVPCEDTENRKPGPFNKYINDPNGKSDVIGPVDHVSAISDAVLSSSPHALYNDRKEVNLCSSLSKLATCFMDATMSCSTAKVLHQGLKDQHNGEKEEQVASGSCAEDVMEDATVKDKESGVIQPPSWERSYLKDGEPNSDMEGAEVVESDLSCNKEASDTFDNESIKSIVGKRTTSCSDVPKESPVDLNLQQEPLDDFVAKNTLDGSATFGEESVSGVGSMENPSFDLVNPDYKHEGSLSEEAALKIRKEFVGRRSPSPRQLVTELQFLFSKENIEESDSHALAFSSGERRDESTIPHDENMVEVHLADLLDESIKRSKAGALHQGHKNQHNEDKDEQFVFRTCTNDIFESDTEKPVVLLPAEERSKLEEGQLNSNLEGANESGLNCTKNVINTSDNGSIANQIIPSSFGLPKASPLNHNLQQENGDISVSRVQGTVANPSLDLATFDCKHEGSLSEEAVHTMKNNAETCSSNPRQLVMQLQYLFSDENIQDSDSHVALAFPCAESAGDVSTVCHVEQRFEAHVSSEPDKYQGSHQDFSKPEEKEGRMFASLQDVEGFLKSSQGEDQATSAQCELSEGVNHIEREIFADEMLCEDKEQKCMPSSDSDILHEKKHPNVYGICQYTGQMCMDEFHAKLLSCSTEALHQDHKEAFSELNEDTVTPVFPENYISEATPDIITSELFDEQLSPKLQSVEGEERAFGPDNHTSEIFRSGSAMNVLSHLPIDYGTSSCQKQELPDELSVPKSIEESANGQEESVSGSGLCQTSGHNNCIKESSSNQLTSCSVVVSQDHEQCNENNEDQITPGIPASRMSEAGQIEMLERKISLTPSVGTSALPVEQVNTKLESNKIQGQSCYSDEDTCGLFDTESVETCKASNLPKDTHMDPSSECAPADKTDSPAELNPDRSDSHGDEH